MATVTLSSGGDQQVQAGDRYKYVVGSGETRVRLLIGNPHVVKLRVRVQPGGTGEEFAAEVDGDIETREKRTAVIDPVTENDVVWFDPVIAPETGNGQSYINATGIA